jgi:hypothetical protein
LLIVVEREWIGSRGWLVRLNEKGELSTGQKKKKKSWRMIDEEEAEKVKLQAWSNHSEGEADI